MTTAQREYQQAYYDRTYPRRAAAAREQLVHPLFRSFNDRLAGRVLDAVGDHGRTEPLRIFEPACGEGFLGASLLHVARERGLDLRYAAADLSEAALDLARPHLGDDLVAGDAAHTTGALAEGAADVIVVKNLLHHLAEPAAVLREAGRVVGSEGRVVIVEARLGCPHFVLLGSLAPRRERFYFHGTRRNREAVARAGLTILHRERFSSLPYELFFQSRFRAMRRLLSTSDRRAIRWWSRLDDGLATALPWFASYWLWVAAPAATTSGRANST